MVTRVSERTALIMWIACVALCIAAVWNVALDPTPGAWRAVAGSLLPTGIWFWLWRQRRRTRDGTLEQQSR